MMFAYFNRWYRLVIAALGVASAEPERQFGLRTTPLVVLAALVACIALSFDAQAANLISQFESARGPVSHLEEANGKAHLLLERTGKRVPLPPQWKNTNVEQTMDLGSQTAVVVSYSDRSCDARLALLVVTPAIVWGPYQLGECNDMLAYQRSDDGTSFVAIRANGTRPLAWVYSAFDQELRGPAKIALPSSLAALASVPEPEPPRPIAPPVAKMPAPPNQATPPPPKPTTPAPTKPTAPPPVAVPVLSQKDAGTVADEVRRTTRSQRRVNIDLT